MVVMFSVFAGIPLWGLFLHTTTFERSLFWFFCFTLIATWASASANRPICAELVKTPAERAQIISMWMVLEQSSSAIFGAPLVGFLVSGKSEDAESPEELAGKLGVVLKPLLKMLYCNSIQHSCYVLDWRYCLVSLWHGMGSHVASNRF